MSWFESRLGNMIGNPLYIKGFFVSDYFYFLNPILSLSSHFL
jgi:hypothetical protein